NESAFYWQPTPGDLLIEARSLESGVAVLALDQESAVLQLKELGAVEFEFGLRGVGARRDLEVIFEASLVAVEDQVDSGIDVVVADAGKLRNAAAPLCRVVAEKIIALGGQEIGRGQTG